MILLLRTIILFIFVLLSMRLMGKRQIGELQPYEFIVALMVSEIAVIPMQNPSIPIIYGVIPVLTILILQLLVSLLCIRSIRFRNFISGKPTILIKKGVVDVQNMQKELFNMSDLMEQLRSAGKSSISEVPWAIIEANGQISILETDELAIEVIVDGRLIRENLEFRGFSDAWLQHKLNENGFRNFKNIFFASLEADNSVFVQTYKNETFICK